MLGAIVSSLVLLLAPLEGPPQLPSPVPPSAPIPEPSVLPQGTPAELPQQMANGPRYVFEVRDLQVEGLDWRGVLKGRTRRLDWQAGLMVWAVGEPAVRDLVNYVEKTARSSVVQAPSAVAAAGQSARTMTGSTVQLIVDLERQGEKPTGREGGLAYQPILEQMHNGLDMALSATPTPEGLVVGVNLDETSLQGVHTGSFEDAITGPEGGDQGPIAGLFRRFGEGNDPAVSKTGAMKLQASFQVPEIIRSHVEGAWPVKPGESLVISLGARSQSEKWGRSTVVERLVVVTARPETAADRHPGALAKPASAPPPPPVPESVSPLGLPSAAPPPPGIPGVLPDLTPVPGGLPTPGGLPR
ncbi:hypothetical protein [Tautonia rosea]|uniref:hypothetical protein n=1 Tax=Tautonia rosea TaxID=2728037 RepID=UPI001472C0D2|nr:hypothetical protein [Tautonia rosea]